MARVPAAMRASGPAARAAGRRPACASAAPAGDAALCADICQPPFLVYSLRVEPAPGDGREDLFEALGAVALEQLERLALLDETALVDHGEPVAVALCLLHQVRGDEDR